MVRRIAAPGRRAGRIEQPHHSSNCRRDSLGSPPIRPPSPDERRGCESGSSALGPRRQPTGTHETRQCAERTAGKRRRIVIPAHAPSNGDGRPPTSARALLTVVIVRDGGRTWRPRRVADTRMVRCTGSAVNRPRRGTAKQSAAFPARRIQGGASIADPLITACSTPYRQGAARLRSRLSPANSKSV